MTGQTRANYSETKLAQTDPCMWTRICTDTQAQVPVPPHGGLGFDRGAGGSGGDKTRPDLVQADLVQAELAPGSARQFCDHFDTF